MARNPGAEDHLVFRDDVFSISINDETKLRISGSHIEFFQNMLVSSVIHTSVSDQVVAAAGGGQSSATTLSASLNFITTVASVGDSCKLPATNLSGACVFVSNESLNICDVYPQSGGQINDVVADSPYSMAPGQKIKFLGRTSLNWETFS